MKIQKAIFCPYLIPIPRASKAASKDNKPETQYFVITA